MWVDKEIGSQFLWFDIERAQSDLGEDHVFG